MEDTSKNTNGIAEGKLPEGASLTQEVKPPIDVPPPAAKPVPKAPVQLSKEEQLEVENIALKVENLAFRKQGIQDAIVELGKQEKINTLSLQDIKKRLGEKYGMDPMRLKIRPDGMMTEDPIGIPARPVQAGPQS